MAVEVLDDLPDQLPAEKTKAKAKGKPKVLAQDKPSVYYDGDVLVIRASALGGCIGNLVRQGLGQTPEPPPDFMQAKFDEGHDAEPIILDWVRGRNYGLFDDFELEDKYGELHDGQARIEIKAGSKLVIRQHYDGFCRDSSGAEYALEAKAWTEGTRESFEKKVRFKGDTSVIEPSSMRSSYIAMQISCAIIGSKMPVLLVVGQKAKQDDDYDGPVEIEDYFTYVIEEPPFKRSEVLARAMLVEQGIEDGKPPPCDVRQYPCGFWSEHDEDEGVWAKNKPVDIGTTDVETALFESLAAEYGAAHAQVKQWEERKKAAKKGLDIAFEGVPDDQPVESPDFIVKKVVQNKKGDIDWKKAAEEAGVKVEDKNVQDKYRKPGYTVSWYVPEVKD